MADTTPSGPTSRGGDSTPTSRGALLEKQGNVQQLGRDVENSGDDQQSVQKPSVPKYGARPECFKNTFQEVSFVLMATIAMATNTFLTGSTVIVTASIGNDLGMTQSQISWIAAAAT